MRKILYALIACVAFCAQSCQESLEDKAEREAKEYTKSFCPTPTVNYTRTDSVVFYKSTKKLYLLLLILRRFRQRRNCQQKISKLFTKEYIKMLTDNPGLKSYKEAGFKFVYIVHSTKEPTKILYQDSFSFTK